MIVITEPKAEAYVANELKPFNTIQFKATRKGKSKALKKAKAFALGCLSAL